MLDDESEALAELVEHLERAQEAIKVLPAPSEDASFPDGAPLSAVFSVALGAVESFASLVSGQLAWSFGPSRLVVSRDGRQLRIAVCRAPAIASWRQDIDAYLAELRRRDQRLLFCAELLGLLLGLGVHWAAVGFAPPAILLSLQHAAPRIFALGQELALL